MTINGGNKKNNQDILKLAVKCMLINTQKEKEISDVLIERYKEDPELSVIEIFKDQGALSQDKIEFLLTFKKYLDTRALDVEFGRLAVANNFSTREAVDEALAFQKDYYEKTEQIKEISGVLLRTKGISLQNCTAILLSQNRIKDDALAQALDDLGATEAEKKEISKRFGAIALKKELISLEQLNQALAAQHGELSLGHERRHIHLILEESTELSNEDTMSILREQKQFERRRLNLEQALSTYNTEIRLNTKLSQLFNYRVPKDGLEAYVSKSQDLSGEIKLYEFLIWLKQTGIKYGIVDDTTIEDLIFNKNIEEEVLIAKGYPPADGEDESIEYMFDTDFSFSEKESKEDEVPFVKKGDVLANIIPGRKGKPGRDVWGHLIFPPDIKKCFLEYSEGVVREDNSFIADMDGIPALHKGKTLTVLQPQKESGVKNISKNIESETGEEYKAEDLDIEGKIEENGAVKCRNVVLKGDMLGKINATGDVEIKGSVGHVDKNEKEAKIFAEGDIVIKGNISNARLETGKELLAPVAEIVSSNIVAADGILLKTVAFSEENPSVLQIGSIPDPKIYQISILIEAKEAKLKELMHTEEIEKLKEQYQKQIDHENEYLENNAVLKDLIQRLDESESGGVQGLKQNQYPNIPENERKNKYMLEIVKDTGNIEEKDQKEHIEKLLHIESGMYKAAREVTKKLVEDQKTALEPIESEIRDNRKEIDELKLEIETLLLGKDALLSIQTESFILKSAVIKIKDQIAKGTIIKGQASEFIVPETMYGVKLMEIEDSKTGETKISVEGYYS